MTFEGDIVSAKSARAAWTARILATGIAASAVAAAVPAHAIVGEQAQPGSYAFTARLTIGDSERGCTGALVEQQWVLTAASCFADNPGQGFNVAAGAPKLKTTATIAGTVTDVVQLVPREDRDLVLAKLAKPVTGIVPVSIAASAPAQGEELRVTGYGRTKDEWVPGTLHQASFTVGSVKDTSIGLAGKSADAVICQGDTGGPAFRDVNGRQELVAVNSRSWQGGCLGTDPAETRKGALDTRVDDLSGWIASRLLPGQTMASAADYDGDGISDLFSVNSSRELSVSFGKKGGSFSTPKYMSGDWIYDQMVAADFTGDGVIDLIARDPREPKNPKDPKNLLFLWKGNKNGVFDRPIQLSDGWNFSQTVAGDFTGDGKADLIIKDSTNALFVLEGKGDGKFISARKLGDGWRYSQTVAADFTGDGIADLLVRDDRKDEQGKDVAYVRFLKVGKSADLSRPVDRSDGWNFVQTLAGDFTGDGKADLVAKGEATVPPTMWLWSGNGDGTFIRPTKIAEGS
ncbi:FG-GAP-like repeat-containing protein [Streptomyces abikoensis]|uniref:FG-GAP-like repeat-containing protein n=1 Tax=Streptomyces abikoensis TaxID=97398 RepID=UPI0036764232